MFLLKLPHAVLSAKVARRLCAVIAWIYRTASYLCLSTRTIGFVSVEPLFGPNALGDDHLSGGKNRVEFFDVELGLGADVYSGPGSSISAPAVRIFNDGDREGRVENNYILHKEGGEIDGTGNTVKVGTSCCVGLTASQALASRFSAMLGVPKTELNPGSVSTKSRKILKTPST
ncbi:hypothetical protein B0H11DRAFT_1913991 [Mycena galericulata]|nr:hypothetical protein B0H11DRAFT_1913991 [Mycena galericulata]